MTDGLRAPRRILLAHDLSPAAERAVGLIARQKWPPSTIVRIVTSPVGVLSEPSSFDHQQTWRRHSRRLRTAIESAHGTAAELLRGVAEVQTAIIKGAPARAILDDAAEFEADLIVVGSRSHDALSAALLGSVSSAIAQRAPCSVLVVRVEADERVLIGTDGSTLARAAAAAIRAWPLFADSSVRVMAVAVDPPPELETEGQAPGLPGMNASPGDNAALEHARSVVADLAAAGRRVELDIRHGKPGTTINAAAREWPADVVVVGARGDSLLRRLLLGSVAKQVLNGVPASSVLIVRAPESPEPLGPTSDS